MVRSSDLLYQRATINTTEKIDMRQLTALVLAIALVGTTTGCATARINSGGVTYGSYGVFSEDRQNPYVAYDISWGNVFWGVVGFPTILFPIYCFGYNLYEPVGFKSNRPDQHGGVLLVPK